MKLFRYSLGTIERFGVAEDEQDAYESRSDVDPSFDYLPIVIEEIKVDGYTIAVTPDVGTVKNKGGRPRKVEV